MGLIFLAEKAKRFKHRSDRAFETVFLESNLFTSSAPEFEETYRFRCPSATGIIAPGSKATLVSLDESVTIATGPSVIGEADNESKKALQAFFASHPELCGEVPAVFLEQEILTGDYLVKIERPQEGSK